MAREAGNGIQSWYSEIGNNPKSAELWVNGMADPHNLTQAELLQFFFHIFTIRVNKYVAETTSFFGR